MCPTRVIKHVDAQSQDKTRYNQPYPAALERIQQNIVTIDKRVYKAKKQDTIHQKNLNDYHDNKAPQDR